MKTNRPNLKRACLFALSLACLLAIPACVSVTCRHATPEVPFVINFEFLKPITPRAGEEKRLIRALEKYAVRSATRIHLDGAIFWPPPIPPVEKMKTAQMMKSEKASPKKTDSTQAMAMMSPSDGDGLHTSRPAKTDYLSFATEKDLRGFLDCLAGGTCP